MAEKKRQLHLGLATYPVGWDPVAWRLPEAYNGGITDPQLAVDLARTAERGKFDHIFIGSSYANAPESHTNITRWDSFIAASYVSAVTRDIGLLVSANSSLEHPFFLARQLSTLDHFSGGRAGINIVFGIDRAGNPPANVGKHPVPDNEGKYLRAREFTEILYLLLNSWDRDFLVDDREGGRLVDPEKFHAINYHGEHFDVAGPLNAPPPVQNRIPNFHVGTSIDSLEYGAEFAQARFSPWYNQEQAKRTYKEHKERVAKYGNDPDKFVILPGVEIYPAATRREAVEKFREIQGFVRRQAIPKGLSRVLGLDLTGVKESERVFDVVNIEAVLNDPWADIFKDPDAPQPSIAAGQTAATNTLTTQRNVLDFEIQGFAHWLKEYVLNVFTPDELTFKDLYEFLRWRSHFPVLVGDGKKIADWLEEQFLEETLDGVQVFPSYHHGPADRFVDFVVPELQRRGIYRTEYEERTFEQRLGTA